MSRVLLAMSGGVDSSVAASLLLRAGHEVTGVFMRHGVTAESLEEAACATASAHAPSLLPVVSAASTHKQGCCTAADAEDARKVADRLDIPFYALDFQDAFGRIIDYFIDEYTQARTPNPCIACNNWIKFGKLFDYADAIGAEFVATGHYARLDASAVNPPALLMGVDESKDQSYVLFGLSRDVLSRVIFPVGDRRKSEIRQIAAELGLRVAEKKDSQEICFVTSGKHGDFIRKRREKETAGEIVTTDGRVVGHHEGFESFTIGQRKGLGVALGERRFVVEIDPATRRVVLGDREDLARRELTARDVNWLVDPPTAPRPCRAKIRYNAPAVPATVECIEDNRIAVHFDRPVYGVAPGQAVVSYDNDRVLAGGWIE
jgi:tRNA-uridine 2-sulfurtransferase